jgi:hypothetical protein
MTYVSVLLLKFCPYLTTLNRLIKMYNVEWKDYYEDEFERTLKEATVNIFFLTEEREI